MPAVSNNLEVYLNQWVKIASGDRVVLARGIALSSYTGNSGYTNKGYLVFKCTACGDNWHVGLENFHDNVTDPAAETIPSVLSDWVKKHRHVCNKYFSSTAGIAGLCATCKWPYGAHEESWSKDVLNQKGEPIPGVKWVYPIVEPVEVVKSVKIAEQPTGRMFREK
jgi:hypothetical protein